MDDWFRRIANDPDNLVIIGEMIIYYENELATLHAETEISNHVSVESRNLPGIFDYRLQQSISLKSIKEVLEIKLDAMRSQMYRKYAENYARELKITEINRFVDGEQEIISMKMLMAQVGHLVDQWAGKIRSLETKHYQISNLVKLQVAGLLDAVIE